MYLKPARINLDRIVQSLCEVHRKIVGGSVNKNNTSLSVQAGGTICHTNRHEESSNNHLRIFFRWGHTTANKAARNRSEDISGVKHDEHNLSDFLGCFLAKSIFRIALKKQMSMYLALIW